MHMIAEKHGADALVQLLRGYRAGQSTEQVFQSVLKTDIKVFDKQFEDYMRQRYAGPLAALKKVDSLAFEPSMTPQEILRIATTPAARESYALQMIAGRLLLDGGNDSLAIGPLERAKELFPEYGGADSPYPDLVKIYSSRPDQVSKLLPVLETVTSLGEDNYDANIALADLYEMANDPARAAAALDRAMYINPFHVPVHQRMADLFEKTGNWRLAVRERRAVVALNPVDRADAHYQLARSLLDAGSRDEARREVLRALEAAPNYGSSP
jgi:tetratricopeptide (TPR) repeat protein